MTTYKEAYQNLPEKLAEQYKDLNFDNHCYLRIALDNTLKTRWDTLIKKPAYKNLNAEQLEQVVEHLRLYQQSEKLLFEHHQNSLDWRKDHGDGKKQYKLF